MTTRRSLRTAQLPSGKRLRFELGDVPARVEPRDDAPFFSEVADVLGRDDVRVFEGSKRVDLDRLSLADFHALRALLTAHGWIEEESIEIKCRNCGSEIALRPCEKMPLGPFLDHELGDEELDTTLDLTVPHALSDGRELRLRALTVADVKPLHAAIARGPLRLDAELVRAMGITELGGESDPAKIAAALEDMSDELWAEVTDLFLAAHYPLRLLGVVVCPSCTARNDVDAPYEREFEPSALPGRPQERFPEFDAFDEKSREIARKVFQEQGLDLDRAGEVEDARERIVLVVESGTPACDDGGEPLLGSYVPAIAGDTAVPARPAEITVFYRTFRAMWDEDGAYDWSAELQETIEHELEHHFAFLRGDDPVDDAEREEIALEAKRVLGKREIARQGVRALGSDFAGFMRRTWPFWLLLVAVIAIVTLIGER